MNGLSGDNVLQFMQKFGQMANGNDHRLHDSFHDESGSLRVAKLNVEHKFVTSSSSAPTSAPTSTPNCGILLLFNTLIFIKYL